MAQAASVQINSAEIARQAFDAAGKNGAGGQLGFTSGVQAAISPDGKSTIESLAVFPKLLPLEATKTLGLESSVSGLDIKGVAVQAKSTGFAKTASQAELKHSFSNDGIGRGGGGGGRGGPD